MAITKTDAELAEYLTRTNATLVIGVTRIAARSHDFRGKVNLGKEAGAKGDNSRSARPVEKAEMWGLIESRQDIGRGNCYIYNATECGRNVLAILRNHREAE